MATSNASADERAASREAGEAIGRLLAAAGREADEPDADRPIAIVGAVEPEQHVLGSQLARLLLLHRGWNVEHLGTGVPAPEIVATQRALDASLVCVSFTPPATAADVLRFIEAAGELADPAHPFALVLGGNTVHGARMSGGDGAFTDLVALEGLAAFRDWLDDRG